MPKDPISNKLKRIEEQMLVEYKQHSHLVLLHMIQDIRGMIARRKIFLKQHKIVQQKSRLLCEEVHDRDYELEVARWENEGGMYG